MPRSWSIVWLVPAAVFAGACQRSPAEALVDRSVAQLQVVLGLLQDAHGDAGKLLEATLAWRGQHARDVTALRNDAEAVMAGLEDHERIRVETAARNRATPLMARIDAETQKFAQPREAWRMIMPLMPQARPRGYTGRPPWLPEVPPLPPELLPAPASPTVPSR